MTDNAAKLAAEKAKWHRQHLLAVRLLTRHGRNTSNFTHKNLDKKLRNMLNAEKVERKMAKAARKDEPQIIPLEPAWRNAVENKLLSRTRRRRRRSQRLL